MPLSDDCVSDFATFYGDLSDAFSFFPSVINYNDTMSLLDVHFGRW